jgi:nicotinate-nucleotide adenylyltransferase
MLEIMQWKDAETLFDTAHFIAATRPGYDIARFDAHPNVTAMHIPALAISSTDIRARVHDGRPIRFLVPEGVESYIRKVGLYR